MNPSWGGAALGVLIALPGIALLRRPDWFVRYVMFGRNWLREGSRHPSPAGLRAGRLAGALIVGIGLLFIVGVVEPVSQTGG